MAVPWSEIAAHRERLVRIARTRVPTRDDAEDVAQEAMLRCATFDDLDEERLAQFLTAVTVRLCADVHRQVDRGSRLARRLDLEEVPTPEELACAASDAELVRDVLRSLPEKQRLVLVDRAEGLSVTQISRRHSLTYKGVESALSRARTQMRSALAAAMALLWGAAEFLRRRPAVESVVPAATVATVAVAATVLLPLAPGAPHGDAGAGSLAAPRRPASAPHAVSPRDVLAVEVAPAPRPPSRDAGPDPRPTGRPTPRPVPTPTETYIDVETGGNEASVTDDRGSRPYLQDVHDCLVYGADVAYSPSVSPRPSLRGYATCNRS